jgi:hydrogenase nickel incorporation protein HypA/HybF
LLIVEAMHEFSITCSIVDLVAETARGRKVHRVTVEIGQLSGVVADSIAFWFPEVARGTPIETASLDIREVAASARCDDCGAEFATPTMLTPCPCGSFRFARLRGEELKVKSIELEEVH